MTNDELLRVRKRTMSQTVSDEVLHNVKQQFIEDLCEKAQTRPMIRMAVDYIRVARDLNEVLNIVIRVMLTQDESIDSIMTSLIDAEQRAMPRSMFVQTEEREDESK